MEDQSTASNSFMPPMGGNAGDGSFLRNATGDQSEPGAAAPPSSPYGSDMASPGNSNVYGGGYNNSNNVRTPGAGSITQFATPTLQQQQQATYQAPQNSPYSFTPPPQPTNMIGTGGGTGMSFAQRSAMMQQQAGGGGGGYYGGGPQQQPQGQGMMSSQQPPVSQIHVPQQQPPQPSNAYQGGASGSGMSFAQRSQAIQQQQQQPPSTPQQQQQYQSNNFSSMPGGSNAMYPPTPSTPQQQQSQQYGGGYSSQNMQQPQLQQQQQQPPQTPPPQQQQSQMMGSSYNRGQPSLQPTMGSSSYAQRSAMMAQSQQYPSSQQQYAPPAQQQYQQPQGGGSMSGSMMQPQGQPGSARMGTPQQQQQQQPRNPLMDPPEVLAQQQRLLTDATRKVQEHAYYMKQAMERNDLPTVLDRASQMVGELGEHAHAHHHHHVHPPAPGATGSTTALSPKNYYELHLRALEELPTLEDYLLNLSQQQSAPPAPNQTPQQQPMSPDTGSNNPLMMGGAPGSTNQSPMNYGSNPQMMQQQQYQFQQQFPHYTPPKVSYTMKELYDCVQYCPNVLSRLYLQICAASALIRSGEYSTRWVMKDMIEAVKCVQNPVRGLFLRHYLLQAFRDKLPDEPIPPDQIGRPIGTRSAAPSGENSNPVENVSTPAPVMSSDESTKNEQGTVKDSYEFILANFIEMNKLWVRIQHLPGDGKSKEVRRRREKDRNELRILVGTNLVRLSALDSITSAIYGQVILPTVLDHIVICADPLAQAYLMDCLVQVFPDEYHIETMPILLGVCPKLREKVNIRTILQSLMDRLANYLADEELLDEKDSNLVKQSVALDSFRMFDECVQNVYNARGPKLNPKEVIRLQTALLSFSMKCYKGNLEQVTLCLKNCVEALRQARDNAMLMHDPNMQQQQAPTAKGLDEVATKELEKILSIPLDELALGVLNLDYYADLISFLPWNNRRQVALSMLKAVSNAGKSPDSVKEIDELFSVIAPVLRDEHDAAPISHQEISDGMERTANLMAGLGVSPQPQRYLSQSSYDAGVVDPTMYQQDAAFVSKLIDMLDHRDTDVLYEMLSVARNHLNAGKRQRVGIAYGALVFASLKLARRIFNEENCLAEPQEKPGGSADEHSDKVSAGKEEKVDDDQEAKEQAVEAKDEMGDGREVGENDETTGNDKEEKIEKKKEAAVDEQTTPAPDCDLPKTPKTITCRKVFVFVQQTIAALAKVNPEHGVKLYLEAALTADRLGLCVPEGQQNDFGTIAYELISQSFVLYEEHAVTDSRLQARSVLAMIGTLLACRLLIKEDYEGLIMKVSKYAAKMLKKPEQCEMVALCAHLFYVIGDDDETVIYSNPQRCLECLQRSLKLADACTNTNPVNLRLFVNLLDLYLHFFEKKNPSITANYITGLVALIKEHTDNLGQFGGSVDTSPVGEAKAQFLQIVRHISKMKQNEGTAERFAGIDVSNVAI